MILSEWTQHDTEICEKAEKSGIGFNLKTGKLMTFDELKIMAGEYDKVRDVISLDEFLKDRIISVPMDRIDDLE